MERAARQLRQANGLRGRIRWMEPLPGALKSRCASAGARTHRSRSAAAPAAAAPRRFRLLACDGGDRKQRAVRGRARGRRREGLGVHGLAGRLVFPLATRRKGASCCPPLHHPPPKSCVPTTLGFRTCRWESRGERAGSCPADGARVWYLSCKHGSGEKQKTTAP